jgi:hypothetical protein
VLGYGDRPRCGGLDVLRQRQPNRALAVSLLRPLVTRLLAAGCTPRYMVRHTPGSERGVDPH